MTNHDPARRIILHAEALLAQKGWERSTDYGTKPTEYWSEPRESDGVTKVWIVATDYPERVRARSYYSTAEARDAHMASLQELDQGKLLAKASLRPGKSRQDDERCRYHLDAVINCSDLARKLPSDALTPEAVAVALCAAS